jgi:hypothetical protein
MTQPQHDPKTTGHPGHELRDTNIRAVLFSGVALAGLIVGTLLLVHWTVGYLAKTQPISETVPPALLVDGRPRPAAGPQISPKPREELVHLRAAEDARLTTYGQDPLTGAIHIPIDQAMRRVLEKGLPVRISEK